MYVSNVIPELGEIFLRFSSFTDRHVKREELIERINKLRKKDIRYSLAVPGVEGQVITGLFSSVVDSTGGVIAKVSAEAIPWLLYVGRGVGYSQIEPYLLIKMKSIYHKRLYFLLCAKAYNGVTSFTIKRESFYTALGIPNGMPVHDVQTRCLAEFQKYLEENGSVFCFAFEPVTIGGPKAGRPTIGRFGMTFNMRPEYLEHKRKNDPNFESLVLLQRLIPVLRKRRPHVIAIPEIHNQLVQANCSQAFVQAISAYSNLTIEHQANNLPLILKDRFGIDVYSAKDCPENDVKE